jgi:hypothetical protein
MLFGLAIEDPWRWEERIAMLDQVEFQYPSHLPLYFVLHTIPLRLHVGKSLQR